MTDINKIDKSQDSDDFYGKEKISSLFIKIVIPSILAMIITGTQNMIDGLFLGNYIGENAMASANIANPFTSAKMAVSFVVIIGGLAYMGRSLGENNVNKAKDIFKTCFITLIVSSIVIITVGNIFSTQISMALGANDVLLKGTSDYIKILSTFTPFIMMYLLFSFTNRITGNQNLLFIASFCCVIGNIILNYVFIVILDLGMTGAGMATGSSYAIGFFINLAPMISKSNVVNIFDGKFSFAILKKVLYNGSSEGITSLSTGITVLLFNKTFMQIYGEAGVASYTIISYISQMTTIIMFGLVDGIAPIVSYNYGAKLHKRVKKVVIISIIWNLITGVLAYTLITMYGQTLIGFFAKENLELIELTYNGAKIYAISFIFIGFNLVISSYFTSIGDALKSAIVSSSRGIICILIGMAFLPKLFQVTGVWCVAPFADITTAFIAIYLLNKKQQTK